MKDPIKLCMKTHDLKKCIEFRRNLVFHDYKCIIEGFQKQKNSTGIHAYEINH